MICYCSFVQVDVDSLIHAVADVGQITDPHEEQLHLVFVFKNGVTFLKKWVPGNGTIFGTTNGP